MQAATKDSSGAGGAVGWTTTQVGTGEGLGLSFATDGTTAVAASYTGAKSVEVATFDGSSWTSTPVADAADPDPSVTGNLAPVTATAIAKDGIVYVAWVDDGLHLSSGTDSFTPVDTGHTTASGIDPSLAVSDGGVALSWYETQQQNLMVGFIGDLQDVLVAQPSPSLTVSQGPSGGGECGGKTEALDEVAKSLSFENGCLVAPAGKPFEITFDNEDAGVQHNIQIFTDSSATDSLFQGELVTGVATTTYPVDALDAGTYFFHCDVHPTMTGQIAVVKGAS
jgi:plastocyanin